MIQSGLVPLKRKLIKTNFTTLFTALLIFCVTIFYGLNNLSQQYSKQSTERSEEVKASYEKIASDNIKKIQVFYQEQMEKKGRELLFKDISSLAPLIAKGAQGAVQDFLQKTFEADPTFDSVSYFTLSQESINAWYYVSGDYRSGLRPPIVYDIKKQGWQGKTQEGHTVFIPDPAVLDMIKLHEPDIQVREKIVKGFKYKLSNSDCVIPFVNGRSGEAVEKARKRGQPIGFLRYVLSTDEMQMDINAEQKTLERRLKAIEMGNQTALAKMTALTKSAYKKVLFFLSLAALLVLGGGYAASVYAAEQISNPIKALTVSAQSMAGGNYVQKIDLKSDDEIGILADTFQLMSQAIQRRDEELESINKNLETMVEERTSTIQTILNNVKFGFFLVGPDLQIQDGFTKSCTDLFSRNFGAGMPFSTVLGLDERGRANFVVLLEQVFEDILDEDLTLSQIPPRYSVGGKILQLAGSVIRGPKKEIRSILFTVSDATDLDRAERESRTNATLIQILRQRDAFQDFVTDVEKSIRGGSLSLQSGDQKMARGVLHTLKGNMAAFGLHEVAALIHFLEDKLTIEAIDFHEIEQKFKVFLESYSSVLSVSYDQKREDIYHVRRGMIEALKTRMQASKTHEEDIQNLTQWIQSILRKKASDLVGPLPEYVARLAERLGKRVRMVIENGDLLIDPKAVRPLISMLPHLVRNSLDHGLEYPNERSPKPEVGSLVVAFREEPNFWGVKISDDGRGIDTNALVEKAIKLKLVDRETVKKLSEVEKYQFIFKLGISSRDEITDVSGRGMGLSAVVKTVQDLGGEIRIQSKLKEGTVFDITVAKTEI